MPGQSYEYVLVILNVYLIIKYFLCIDQALVLMVLRLLGE